MAGYYRHFVKDFGKIAQSLTTLLKGTGSFQWTAEADQAFKQLKQALLIAPVLALLNFTLPFVIEADASRVGIRAIFVQQDHPLAFISKALSPIH